MMNFVPGSEQKQIEQSCERANRYNYSTLNESNIIRYLKDNEVCLNAYLTYEPEKTLTIRNLEEYRKLALLHLGVLKRMQIKRFNFNVTQNPYEIPRTVLSSYTEHDIRNWFHGVVETIAENFESTTSGYKTNDSTPQQLLASNIFERIRTLRIWSYLVQWLKFFRYIGQEFEGYYYVATLPTYLWGILQCFTLGFQNDPEVVSGMEIILDNAPRVQKDITVWRTVLNHGGFNNRHIRDSRMHAISTTLFPETAIYLGNSQHSVFAIDVLKNQRILFVGPLSQYFHQWEVILDARESHSTVHYPVNQLKKIYHKVDLEEAETIFEKLGNDPAQHKLTFPNEDQWEWMNIYQHFDILEDENSYELLMKTHEDEEDQYQDEDEESGDEY